MNRLLFLFLAAGLGAANADPVKTHPRLLFRAEELPSLRARMTNANDAWVAFKTEIVDKCLRDYKCSATSHYSGPPNYTWIRDSFTDENGTLHLPADADWGAWSDQTARPACPEDDDGNGSSYTRVNSEQYAMIFALMARLLKDQPGQSVQRAEYLAASKDCLFHVIDHAKDGHPPPDSEGHYPPFQHIGFAVDDRSFSAEAFALAVDWIYEDLTADELAKVRKTFLIWADDCNQHVYFAPTYPHGTANSPSLLRLSDPYQQQTRAELRLALNNHYTNHLREMVLYSLAMDPKDDIPSATHSDTAPAGTLTSHVISGAPDNWVRQQSGVLFDAMGVWQYLADYALRTDGAGGISVEGSQYASNGLGPMAIMLAGLNSAGQDDVQAWGPQANVSRHPFWSLTVPSYLAQLTPMSRVPTGVNLGYLGPIYQPPLSGDLENFLYINDQMIKVLAPMALVDQRANGNSGPIIQAVRYIQRNLAQGGPSNFAGRIATTKGSTALRDAIYYFLLFDPAAPAPADPRPAMQPKTLFSQHTVNGKLMGMVLGRSGYTASDTYFHWRLDWNRIDHQRGDSLGFGLWKNGLWLTKGMTGYGTLQGCSDYRNSLSLQNGVPTGSPVGEDTTAAHGSQWDYSPIGDPEITARSTADGFLFFSGDATNLYNHQYQTTLREIEHASRSIMWLKPDHVIVYDRAKSKSAGYYKKFFVNVPRDPVITGNVAWSPAMEGAVEKGRIFVTSLLPAGASIQWKTINDGQPAGGIDSGTGRPSFEDMWSQIYVAAPGAPQETRFLHVIQGTDAGVTSADAAQVVTSSDGEFEGAVAGSRCVIFRKTLGSPPAALSYTHPAGVTTHYITGLAPFAGFNVAQAGTTVTLTANGTQRFTDGGGVLVLGGSEPVNVEITTTDSTGSESGDAVSFLLKRSGDVSAPLDVTLTIDSILSAASTADFVSFPAAVSFAAGSAAATLTLTPADDATFEGTENLVVQIVDGAGYHAAEVSAKAEATLTDNDAPPGGTLQFSGAAFSVAENAGSATIAVTRTGGSTGAVSVLVSTTNGTASAPGDYTNTSQLLGWAAGDSAVKTVNVPVIDNATYGGNKTINLTLSQLSGQAGYGPVPTAVLTILDNEPPPPGSFKLSPLSSTVAENGATSVTFDVERTGGDGGAVSVQYATVNGTATAGSDFIAKSGTLNWANLDAHIEHVTVTLTDDSTYEGDESFTFALTNPTGGAGLDGAATATVNITENDPLPAEFHIGTGQPYTTLASVPWHLAAAGSTVYIHYQATPFPGKVLLPNRGTATLPIRVIGVKGAGGERPVIDGNNAAPPPSSTTYNNETSGASEDSGLIVIERAQGMSSTFKPGYIEIRGLELKNAHPDFSYTRQTGGAADAWSSAAGAIYLRGAEHVTVRDCIIHHCANGIETNQGGTEERNLTRDVLITHCHFHSNGKIGSYYGRNLETQAVGVTLQFCRLDEPLSGSNVENVRDLSAGFIGRCNYITGGGSQFTFDEPYGAVPLITGDASHGITHVWGNVLRNFGGGSGNVLHFGSTNLPGDRVLHFHHNTVHCETSYSRNLLNIHAAGDSALATNNIVRHAGITEFYLNSGPGTVTLGKNLLTPGYLSNAGATGLANIITSASIGFANEAGGDYHLAAGSPALDAAAALPAGALPAFAQYYHHGLGVLRHRAGAADDLGAFESVLPVDAWLVAHFGLDAATPSIAGDLADPDGDQSGNLLEYALDHDPLLPTAHLLPGAANEGGYATMNIARNVSATDVTFSVEVSGDLATWQNGPSFTTALIDAPAQLKVRDNVAVSAGSRRFIRLRVSR